MIRALQWSDFEDLTENYYALYEEVKSDPDLGISLFPARPTMAEESAWFASLFRRVLEGTSVAFVAEETGKAVGLCHVDRKSPAAEGLHVGVLGILVAKAWRGRGIGKSLLEATLGRCRERFELVELSVYATNLHARELYRSVGFVSWGVLPRGIRRGDRYIDLEHMVVDLTKN